MNYRHPWQLKKSKSWEPFWSYQLNSTANPAHLPQNWQCYLAGSSKTAPRILIFRIAMGADCSFYVKSIGTCALTFFGYLYYFSLSQCEPAHFCFIKCSKRIQDFIKKTLLFTK